MSVKITIENVRSAIDDLEALHGRIESQRNHVTSGTPVAVPSMAGRSCPGPGRSWLEDQVPALQMVLDIGRLLESDGSGVATLDMADLSLDDAATSLGTELGKRIGDDDLEFRTPADRERFELYAELLGDVANNADATKALMEETGPAGPMGAMYRMSETMNEMDPTHSYWIGWEYSGEAGEDYDSQEERQKFEDMAALFAQNSALLVANGSRNGAISADGARRCSRPAARPCRRSCSRPPTTRATSSTATSSGSMGEGLSEWERGSYTKYIEDGLEDTYWPGMRPATCRTRTTPRWRSCSTRATGSTQTRQGLAGNENFLEYMLVERQDEDMDGVGVDHFDDILQGATIEVADRPDVLPQRGGDLRDHVKIAGEATASATTTTTRSAASSRCTSRTRTGRSADPDGSTGSRSNGPDGVPPYGIDDRGHRRPHQRAEPRGRQRHRGQRHR